jgi:hypothetical protein
VARSGSAPDGKRFAGIVDPGSRSAPGAPQAEHVDVVLNWFEELKAKTRSSR